MSARPDFNRYDYIECLLPNQKDGFRKHTVEILEKDDLSLLNIRRPHVAYFLENNKPKHYEKQSLYDLLNKPDLNYDPHVQRCNRTSQRTAWKTLHIEESERTVPARVSALYGKRKPFTDGLELEGHQSYNMCKEFQTRGKLTLKQDTDLKMGFSKND